MTDRNTPTIGFVLEQTLGHRTHAANLRSVIGADAGIDPVWLPVPQDQQGPARWLPGGGNWTVRAGVRARRAIAGAHRSTPLDALFVHTQVPAVLVPDWLDRIPTVVSLDATPLQYDELGASYDHARSPAWVESLKWRVHRRTFDRAVAVVAWSHWAARGVVDGYGVPADKVHVLAPGVRPAAWAPPAPRRSPAPGSPVRILFVGGDLARKGGPLLLDAFGELRARLAGMGSVVELDVVTQGDVDAQPGVTVHRGLDPNSDALRALYHRADVFCLPTLGDCLPMVLAEAGAAGLPLVATRVGAIEELVRHDETGLLVEPGDRSGLVTALERLVGDADLRCRLGAAAARLVRRDHDVELNTGRLVELLQAAAAAPVVGRRRPAPAPRAAAAARPAVLITVSGTVDPGVAEQVATGARPRADYLELASAFGGADVLDHGGARRAGGRLGRLVERVAGPNALLAVATFRLAGRYDAVFTDGEQVGLPLALLFRLRGRRSIHHAMVVHILTVPKKALLLRLFGLGRHIDLFLTYSSWQARALVEDLHLPAERVVLTPFMVDTRWFDASSGQRHRPAGRVVSAVGLECRDYRTLLEAADGLDARVVIAAGSPWSKRPDPTEGQRIPHNVEVCRLDFGQLRQLYLDSDLVVMPLLDVPFQAGVTAILEAMSMGKAVVCTRTAGQTDVVVDGVTGLYVPPGDAPALRAAIQDLLDDPERARRMGAAARQHAVDRYDVATYAAGLAGLVLGDLAGGRVTADRQLKVGPAPFDAPCEGANQRDDRPLVADGDRRPVTADVAAHPD